MTTVYKLTDKNMRTHGGFQWELGKEYTTSGEGDLCGPGWLHCYNDPLIAVLLNPIHADITNPRLFRAKVRGKGKHDRGLKSGYKKMTLVEETPVPKITTEQRVKFAILCSLEVYKDENYVKWAENWLSGEDRSARAAEAVRAAAARAARAAEAAWAAAARAAAEAAAWAAEAAAWAAEAAAWAAEAAAWAALAAAWAAALAAESAKREIDFIAMAHTACDAP